MDNVDTINEFKKDLEDKLSESKQIEESLKTLEDNKSTMEENEYTSQKDNLSRDFYQVQRDIKEINSAIEAYNIIKADIDALEQLSASVNEEDVENFNKKQEAIRKEISDNQRIIDNRRVFKEFAKDINRINKAREAQKEKESNSLENNPSPVEQQEEIKEEPKYELSYEASEISRLLDGYAGLGESIRKNLMSPEASEDYESRMIDLIRDNRNDKSVAYLIIDRKPDFFSYLSGKLRNDYDVINYFAENNIDEARRNIEPRLIEAAANSKKLKEEQALKQLSELEPKISDEEKQELSDFEKKADEATKDIEKELEELNRMIEDFKNGNSDTKTEVEPVIDASTDTIVDTDIDTKTSAAVDTKEEKEQEIITSSTEEPQQEEPVLTDEEAIVANIRDKMGAINATNYFLQDSDKINLAIFEKALETKSVADINNALAYADELKLKNIPGYSPILNDKLNELLEISKSKTPDQVVASTEDEKTTVASNTTDEELRNRPTTPYLGPNDSIFIDESRIDKEHSYLSASNAKNLGYLDKEEEKQDSLANSTPIKKITPIKEKLWIQVEERRNKRLRKKDSNVIEFTYDDEEVKEEEKAYTKTLNMSAFTSISIMAITTTVMSIGIIVLGLMVLK